MTIAGRQEKEVIYSVMEVIYSVITARFPAITRGKSRGR